MREREKRRGREELLLINKIFLQIEKKIFQTIFTFLLSSIPFPLLCSPLLSYCHIHCALNTHYFLSSLSLSFSSTSLFLSLFFFYSILSL